MTKRLSKGPRIEGSGIDRVVRRMIREVEDRPMPTLSTALAPAPDPIEFARMCGFEPDEWQRKVLTSTARKQALLCSRQAGKSTVTACVALREAAYRADALVLLLSASLEQSKELHRKVTHAYATAQANGAGMPNLLPGSVLRSEFVTGARVIALPANEDTVRGFSAATLVIIDEAARVPDELSVAVQPSLATVADGRLIALTTPNGRRGFFYRMWTEDADLEKTIVTALEVPRITQPFLDDQRRMLGEFQFGQEYMCQWLDGTTSVFASELVRAAVRDDVLPLFPDLLSHYAA